MSFSSHKSGLSQSSVGSTQSKYSRASGIRALDNMRAAKAETVDDRQIIYQNRIKEEKQLKADLMTISLLNDKAKRESLRIETKVIPELERQVERAKYDIYSSE